MATGPTPLNPDALLLIRAGDAQALLNYLSGQPCGQVYVLVTTLMNLQPVPKPAPVKEPEKPAEVVPTEAKYETEAAPPDFVPAEPPAES